MKRVVTVVLIAALAIVGFLLVNRNEPVANVRTAHPTPWP